MRLGHDLNRCKQNYISMRQPTRRWRQTAFPEVPFKQHRHFPCICYSIEKHSVLGLPLKMALFDTVFEYLKKKILYC